MSRALLFHGPGQALECVEHETPTPHGREILVRVTCCTLCASDLHTHAGRRAGPTPTVLGHEIVGRIEAFGPDAPHEDARGIALTIGERVSWSVAASCGSCFYCDDGLPQKCVTLFKYGHEEAQGERCFVGGLADHVLLLPGTACYRVPDELSDTEAAPANCAIATAAAVLRGNRLEGRTVLVFGAGALGLTACAMARSAGATAVIVSEPEPTRRERALAFGATHAFAPDELPTALGGVTAGRGADLALELAGTKATVEAGLKRTRIGGTLVLAGTVLPTPAVALDPEAAVRRLLTLRGVHNYVPADLATALDFLAGPGRRFPFAELVARSYRLAEVEQAFAHAHAHPGVRVAVVP